METKHTCRTCGLNFDRPISGTCDGESERSHCGMTPNERLVLAVPDLLAACEAALAFNAAVIELQESQGIRDPIHGRLLAKLTAAIAKAKGIQ